MISFLGTGAYLPCRYDGFGPVTYVQTAVAGLHRAGNPPGPVWIGCTPAAREKHGDALGAEFRDHGLAEPCCIDIPEGGTEAELWRIFDTFLDLVPEQADLVVDVTHSFRSLPVVMTILLQYLKLVKGVTVSGCFYGAFEALGGRKEVEALPAARRNAPLFDLTPMLALYDWGQAIHELERFGDQSRLHDLLRREKARTFPFLSREENRDLDAVTAGLRTFAPAVQTCRQDLIRNMDYTGALQTPLDRLDAGIPPAFRPAVRPLRRQFAGYRTGDVMNGLHAARWCIRRGMTQQALTILQEFLVTWLEESHLGETPAAAWSERDRRALVSKALVVAAKGTPREEWKDTLARDPDLVEAFIGMLDQKFIAQFDRLTQRRNDINHCGYNDNSAPAHRLEQEAADLLAYFEAFVARNG